MVRLVVNLHPRGLTPLESAKAWFLRTEEDKTWSELQDLCVTVDGSRPTVLALRGAVDRVQKSGVDGVARTNYDKCTGRPKSLTACIYACMYVMYVCMCVCLFVCLFCFVACLRDCFLPCVISLSPCEAFLWHTLNPVCAIGSFFLASSHVTD